jgi:DNA-directed RNA polymerase subunit RPC12/RpoP
MSTEQPNTEAEGTTVATTDILFECPSCGKSLVVDEAAEGIIIDCPQCRTNVIVPPRSTKSVPPPAALKVESKPIAEGKSAAANVPPERRLGVLAAQLKEIQSQRTEVSSRIATRLNEVNRDLVMLARLDTSQQQILSEWNQLAERITAAPLADDVDASRPAVVGASVAAGDRTRVAYRDK